MVDVHRLEIDKMAAEMSESKPGSGAYLGCYKKAIKAIEEGLDEDTRQKYRAQATKWSEQQPPPRQQQRYVRNHSIRSEATKFHRLRMFEKHGPRALREFSENMYRQLGVRVVILAGYCDGEGDPAIML